MTSGQTVSEYEGLAYTQAELADAMRSAYDELIDFVTRPSFRQVMEELDKLSSRERPSFVLAILLDPAERKRRGIEPPEGILIQRSAFGDRRPTLFCVKRFLPERFSDVWQNVNLTFDNEFADHSISREPTIAWRQPLPVQLQAEAMARGASLEALP